MDRDPQNPTDWPDADILAASQKRPELFEALVDRYRRAFLRKAISILRDHEDASDAVQEAFVRIYTAGRSYKPVHGASFSSWAYSILVNQCYTSYRKRQRRSFVSLELEPAIAEAAVDEGARADHERGLDRDRAISLLSRLPVMLRKAVEAHFIEGLPEKEIAAREGVSPGAIRQRIHRAKREMRRLDMIYG